MGWGVILQKLKEKILGGGRKSNTGSPVEVCVWVSNSESERG